MLSSNLKKRSLAVHPHQSHQSVLQPLSTMPCERLIFLPQEIQGQIYYHLLHDCSRHVVSPLGPADRPFLKWTSPILSFLPIMCTARSIRDIVLHQLFSRFDINKTSVASSSCVPEQCEYLVRRVWLQLEFSKRLPKEYFKNVYTRCGTHMVTLRTEWRVEDEIAQDFLNKRLEGYPWPFPSLGEGHLIVTLTPFDNLASNTPATIAASFTDTLRVLDLKKVVIGLKCAAEVPQVPSIDTEPTRRIKSIPPICGSGPFFDRERLQLNLWIDHQISSTYDRDAKMVFVGKSYGKHPRDWTEEDVRNHVERFKELPQLSEQELDAGF